MSATPSTGGLRLHARHGKIDTVDVVSTRPQAALLVAQGGEPDERQRAQWAATVRREAANEHLWHLMLAWPPLCGLDNLEREYADCRKRLLQAKSDEEHAAALEAVTASRLLGMPPGDWLRLGRREWDAWRSDSTALGAVLLRAARPPFACARSGLARA